MLVKIINFRNPIIDNRYKLLKLEKKNPLSITKNIVKYILFSKKNKKRSNAFEKFLLNNFNLTKKYSSDFELISNPPKLDYYITGSDQVWNTQITRCVSDIYTLNFGPNNTKKISYAASFGKLDFTDKEIEKFKHNLSKLDSISVRESSAVKFLKEIINKEIYEALDPTLLFEANYWNQKIDTLSKEKEKYVLIYHLEKNIELVKIANYISKYYGYKIIHFEKNNKYYDSVLRSAYVDGPLEFVNLIKNAEFIVSNSFHGTVFSIIFHKDFFVVPHMNTGSRMIDFLKKLNLENRIVYKVDDLKIGQSIEKIDYDNVDKIIEKQRTKSKLFLDSALK